MCEFKVIINGKIMFTDAIYAKEEDNKVVVKDILGDSKEFNNFKISEVDVNSVRLVLSPI